MSYMIWIESSLSSILFNMCHRQNNMHLYSCQFDSLGDAGGHTNSIFADTLYLILFILMPAIPMPATVIPAILLPATLIPAKLIPATLIPATLIPARLILSYANLHYLIYVIMQFLRTMSLRCQSCRLCWGGKS